MHRSTDPHSSGYSASDRPTSQTRDDAGLTSLRELRADLEEFWSQILSELSTFESEVRRILQSDRSALSQADILDHKLQAWAADSHGRSLVEEFARESRIRQGDLDIATAEEDPSLAQSTRHRARSSATDTTDMMGGSSSRLRSRGMGRITVSSVDEDDDYIERHLQHEREEHQRRDKEKEEKDPEQKEEERRREESNQTLSPAEINDDARSMATTYFDPEKPRTEAPGGTVGGAAGKESKAMDTFADIEVTVLVILPHIAMHADGPKNIYNVLIDERYHIADFQEKQLHHSAALKLLLESPIRNRRSDKECRSIAREMSKDVCLLMKVFRADGIAHLQRLTADSTAVEQLIGGPSFNNSEIGVYAACNREQVEFLLKTGFNETLLTGKPSEWLADPDFMNNRSVLIVKPVSAKNSIDAIRAEIVGSDFGIVHEKWMRLSKDIVTRLVYNSNLDLSEKVARLTPMEQRNTFAYLMSAPVAVIIVERLRRAEGVHFYQELSEVIGPPKARDFREESESANSIRAFYGSDDTHNVCEVTLNWTDYCRQIEVLFPMEGPDLINLPAPHIQRMYGKRSKEALAKRDSRKILDIYAGSDDDTIIDAPMLPPIIKEHREEEEDVEEPAASGSNSSSSSTDETGSSSMTEALLFLKDHLSMQQRSEIRELIERQGSLRIRNERTVNLNGYQWRQLLSVPDMENTVGTDVDWSSDEYYRNQVIDSLSDTNIQMLTVNFWTEESDFRLLSELVGPCVPRVAQDISPDSIRARFGVDRVDNGVIATLGKESLKVAQRILGGKSGTTKVKGRASVASSAISTGVMTAPHTLASQRYGKHAEDVHGEVDSDGETVIPQKRRRQPKKTLRERVIPSEGGIVVTDGVATTGLVIIKPHVRSAKVDWILKQLHKAGFEIVNDRACSMPEETWRTLLDMRDESQAAAERVGAPHLLREKWVQNVSGKRVVALLVKRDHCLKKLQELCGPMVYHKAKLYAPKSLIARIGKDDVNSAVWYTRTEKVFESVWQFFFFERSTTASDSLTARLVRGSSNHSSTKGMGHTSVPTQFDGSLGFDIEKEMAEMQEQVAVIIVKPHVTMAQLMELKDEINGSDKFVLFNETANVSCPFSLINDLVNASKDGSETLSLMPRMLRAKLQRYWNSTHLDCHVACIRGISVFRRLSKLFGPLDPEEAVRSHPDCLRAQFGIDRIRNVAYVTDTVASSRIASQYFFGSDDPVTVFGGNPASLPTPSSAAPSTILSGGSSSMSGMSDLTTEHAICVLKPHICRDEENVNGIKSVLKRAGFRIKNASEVVLPAAVFETLVGKHGYTKTILKKVCEHMGSGPSLGLFLYKVGSRDACAELAAVAGNESPEIARMTEEDSGSIRALYGRDMIHNAVFTTENIDQVSELFSHYFYATEPSKASSSTVSSKEKVAAIAATMNLSAPMDEVPGFGGSEYSVSEFGGSGVSGSTSNYRSPVDSKNRYRAIVIIKPHITADQLRLIKKKLKQGGLKLVRQTQVTLPAAAFEELLSVNGGSKDLSRKAEIIEHLASDEITCVLVRSRHGTPDAVSDPNSTFNLLKRIVGDEEPLVAKRQQPRSIRASFGIDLVHNACLFTGSTSAYTLLYEQVFFDSGGSSAPPPRHVIGTTTMDTVPEERGVEDLTMMPITSDILKKEAVSDEGVLRAIVVCLPHLDGEACDEIVQTLEDNGFAIVKESRMQLPRVSAEQMYSDLGYRSAILTRMVDHLVSAECLALMVERMDAYNMLATVMGPEMPTIAEMENPESIRARFGVDQIQNAVCFTRDPTEFVKVRPQFFFDARSSNNVSVAGGSSTKGSTVSGTSRLTKTRSGSKRSGGSSMHSGMSATSSRNSAYDKFGRSRAIVVIKPHIDRTGRKFIKSILKDNDMKIVKQSRLSLPVVAFEEALEFDGYVGGVLKKSAAHLASDEILALLVVYRKKLTDVGDITGYTSGAESVSGMPDTYEVLNNLIGNEDPTIAQLERPESIRAVLGHDIVKNAVYFTRSADAYENLYPQLFFNSEDPDKEDEPADEKVSHGSQNSSVKASSDDGTRLRAILLVKAHAFPQREEIMEILITQGLEVIKHRSVAVPTPVVERLLECEGLRGKLAKQAERVYKEDEVCAVLLEGNRKIYSRLEHICGPGSPDLAQMTRPDSIRALFGKTIIRNAVFFTDNEELFEELFPHFFFGGEELSEPVVTDAFSQFSGVGPSIVSGASSSKSGGSSQAQDESGRFRAIVVLKPEVNDRARLEIISRLRKSGFSIDREQSQSLPASVYAEALEMDGYKGSLLRRSADYMANKDCVALLVTHESNTYKVLSQLVGNDAPDIARMQDASCLRALYGKDIVHNAVYFTKNVRSFEVICSQFFFDLTAGVGGGAATAATLSESVVIIKPHVSEKDSEEIMDILRESGLTIVQQQSLMVPSIVFEEALDAEGTFKDVLLRKVCKSMSDGEVTALLVSAPDTRALLSQIVGNVEPSLAKLENPLSIRGRFGETLIKNAVYYSESAGSTTILRNQLFYHRDSTPATAFLDSGTADESGDVSVVSAGSSSSSGSQSSNASTLRTLTFHDKHTMVVLKPHIVGNQDACAEIRDIVEGHGFAVLSEASAQLTADVFDELVSQKGYSGSIKRKMCAHVASGLSTAWLLRYEGDRSVAHSQSAHDKLKKIIGNEAPEVARLESPGSVRATFGESLVKNAVFISESVEDVRSLFPHYFFDLQSALAGKDGGSGLAKREGSVGSSSRGSRGSAKSGKSVSKEDRMNAGSLSESGEDRSLIICFPGLSGEQIFEIGMRLEQKGFVILKETNAQMNKSTAVEIAEMQGCKGKTADKVATNLSRAEVTVLLIERRDAYNVLEGVIGEWSPELAKLSKPHSIRAIYGSSLHNNGVIYTRNHHEFVFALKLYFFNCKSDDSWGRRKRKYGASSKFGAALTLGSSSGRSRSSSDSSSEPRGLSAAAIESFLPEIEESVLIIKPHAMSHKKSILEAVKQDGFYVARVVENSMPVLFFEELYEKHRGQSYFPSLCESMASAPFAAVQVFAPNAIGKLRRLVGPTDPKIARKEDPSTLRARFGEDAVLNAVHASSNQSSVIRESSELFFTGSSRRRSMMASDSFGLRSIALITPPTSCRYGTQIRAAISAAGVFEVIMEKVMLIDGARMIEQFPFDLDDSSKRLRVIKSVEKQSLKQSEPCILVILQTNGMPLPNSKATTAPDILDDFFGPCSVELARKERPNSVRAQFGNDTHDDIGVYYTKTDEDYDSCLAVFFEKELQDEP